jgi:uncharacterized lipoprotein YajG
MNKCCARLACLAVFSTFLTGCALTKDTIVLNYSPRHDSQKIAGAETVQVEVKITDNRSIRDKVGTKKNGYGVEMAPIVSTNDVVEFVKGAIEAELDRRNFARGNAVQVSGNLTKFYNDFKMGFWAGDSIAELIMTVQVKTPDGRAIYTKNLVAEGKEPGIQVAAGHNAKPALERAIANGINSLFQDKEFISSLFQAAGVSPPSN